MTGRRGDHKVDPALVERQKAQALFHFKEARSKNI